MTELERIGETVKAVLEDQRPTRKQLAYLSRLAYRRGSSYAVPATKAEASAEIKRLLGERQARAGRRRRRKHG